MSPSVKGSFVISLDFEKYWGMLDKRSIDDYRTNLSNTKEAVLRTLQLFEKFEIRATWSTVGFLFLKNLEELKTRVPDLKPSYNIKGFDPYQYIANIDDERFEDDLHFGNAEIGQILNTPGQEISTHTFSHLYMLEEGVGQDVIAADLKMAMLTAKAYDVEFKSIVFPRNQYNNESLQLLKQLGIFVYRGNEKSWLYKSDKDEDHGLSRRFMRLMDGFFNVSGHHTYKPEVRDGMVNIPSSRFLRPYRRKWFFLNRLHLNRIKKSMHHAARRGEVYHLWWHPHNFGANLEDDLVRLEKILEHWHSLKERYAFQSKNMADFLSLKK